MDISCFLVTLGGYCLHHQPSHCHSPHAKDWGTAARTPKHTQLTTGATTPPQPGQSHLIQADPTSVRLKPPQAGCPGAEQPIVMGVSRTQENQTSVPSHHGLKNPYLFHKVLSSPLGQDSPRACQELHALQFWCTLCPLCPPPQ